MFILSDLIFTSNLYNEYTSDLISKSIYKCRNKYVSKRNNLQHQHLIIK